MYNTAGELHDAHSATTCNLLALQKARLLSQILPKAGIFTCTSLAHRTSTKRKCEREAPLTVFQGSLQI